VRAAGDDPFDPDHLWEPWPPLDENAALIGAFSVVVLVGAGALLARSVRSGRTGRSCAAQVLILVALGIWLGAGYAIVTNGVTGANIGGGLVLLITPVVVVGAVGLVVAIGITSQSTPSDAAPQDDGAEPQGPHDQDHREDVGR
jgi:hypothetical protein